MVPVLAAMVLISIAEGAVTSVIGFVVVLVVLGEAGWIIAHARKSENHQLLREGKL